MLLLLEKKIRIIFKIISFKIIFLMKRPIHFLYAIRAFSLEYNDTTVTLLLCCQKKKKQRARWK